MKSKAQKLRSSAGSLEVDNLGNIALCMQQQIEEVWCVRKRKLTRKIILVLSSA